MKPGVAQYRDLDLRTRVADASPHGLVALLYDELLVALDAFLSARRHGRRSASAAQHARALSLLHSLEAGLDAARGGTLATELATIYRQMRRSLGDARDGDLVPIESVRAGVASLAEAWRAVASRPGTSASSRSASSV